ncbi:MAG TPA: plasmid mobilization relaxosome protein MobC [Clostridiaceae bacterium]|nr:plasmid mobilization relaxosome protein MobC [Clostridiaceae bacterium]
MRTRDIKKQVWLNEEELKTLKQNAMKTGLNESTYIRNLIMGYKPKEQPTENMYEIINQLKLIGINLNQIARKANALNLVDAPFYKKVYMKWSKLVKNIKKDFFDMEK